MTAYTCSCAKLIAAGWAVRCAACGTDTFPEAEAPTTGGGVAVSAQTCPHCGPYVFPYGRDAFSFTGEPICPTCEMTPGEHAYRLRILADSAAVYAQEAREFRARRRAAA